MDALARLAEEFEPKLILAGWSAYPRQLDFARFREIAEKSMHDRAVLNNPRPIKGPAEVMEILELAA